jgi:hypothetical protein
MIAGTGNRWRRALHVLALLWVLASLFAWPRAWRRHERERLRVENTAEQLATLEGLLRHSGLRVDELAREEGAARATRPPVGAPPLRAGEHALPTTPPQHSDFRVQRYLSDLVLTGYRTVHLDAEGRLVEFHFDKP